MSSSSEQETKTSHFRNRHYSAEHGRFLQEDPIGFAGGLNLYAYAGNDPATYTDSFGLTAESDCTRFPRLCVALMELFADSRLYAHQIKETIPTNEVRVTTRSGPPPLIGPSSWQRTQAPGASRARRASKRRECHEAPLDTSGHPPADRAFEEAKCKAQHGSSREAEVSFCLVC
ncbi:MAG: RHS repeat-associated core domain-containing protein [Pseudomonas sp.]